MISDDNNIKELTSFTITYLKLRGQYEMNDQTENQKCSNEHLSDETLVFARKNSILSSFIIECAKKV